MTHRLSDLKTRRDYPEDRSFPLCTMGWLNAAEAERVRIQAAGLGDVGRTMLIGLILAGGDLIDEIGIYDLSLPALRRMELELNQIIPPCSPERRVRVRILREEELFEGCDVFLFCATKAVPEIGSGSGDVRMAQYEANKGIIARYAKEASHKRFSGLFGVVSDPVDLLCLSAYEAGLDVRREAQKRGEECPGLHPEQIQGFGLGVMYARAAYYASKTPEQYPHFLEEGRVFGPHGADLVVADSLNLKHYDGQRSRELTKQTVEANLRVRELGFKPYIAPALSSAALSIIAAIRGKWNDSARYLNGLWFGARNRTSLSSRQTEWEAAYRDLPGDLYERLEASYRKLEAFRR